MSQRYDDYIQEHKENVTKAYYWLINNNILKEYSVDTLQMAHYLCESAHDQSKYSEEEYAAYDKYFYGGNKSYAVVEDFNKAWLHHIHNNPHHWQHWVLINDDPNEGEKILDMPEEYIIEMICDWWSFSWKQGRLDEIFTWYDEHKNHMKLSERTRSKVEYILGEIKNKLSDANEQ